MKMETLSQRVLPLTWLLFLYIEIQNISLIRKVTSQKDSSLRIVKEDIRTPTSRLVLDHATVLVNVIYTLIYVLLLILIKWMTTIGQKFAMMEEKIMLASILRHFNLVALDKPSEIVLMSDIILRPRDGIRLSITHRTVK